MGTKVWSFLTAIQELNWKQVTETTKAGAESAKAVFDLAKTVQEKGKDAGALKPYVEQIGSLLEVLNSPLATLVKDTIPFAPIAVTMLQLVCDATKKEPTLEQSVALVVQAAYLESLRSHQFEQYLSIQEYLRDVISPDSTIQVLRDRWRVFNEPFTLKEIYVPLKVRLIDKNGEPEKREPVVLQERAKAWLNNPDEAGKVLFIQGHPGRGKSAFCRMFAEWVRETQHPTWTPILLRLRDVGALEKDFEETLRKAVDRDFAKSDEGWLSDRNTTFLFLLDGFDELLMQGRTSDGLEEFLKQVANFQRSCQSNSEKGHRVLITGRTLSLQSIERQMPSNLERVELLEMDDGLRSRWFAQWLKLAGSEKTQAFQAFLCNQQCPERIQQLSREPLLLYLLAAMHRDGGLDLQMFEGAEGVQAKILIYEQTIDWVLTKQRSDDLTNEITALDTESLRTILAEAGLSVVQAGGECAPLSMIEKRLEQDAEVKDAIAAARERIQENPLRNALAAFYLQPGQAGSGSVEFIHKSFGEFLCAERLKEAIESWTEPGTRRRKFAVDVEQFNWQIYDLLGSPVLSLEIVEYLMELLARSSDFKPVGLFERLHEFYEGWCEGEFIDAPPENLPQRKMRTLKELLPEQKRPLGIRQVDVYAGLNVMLLLLELHRHPDIDYFLASNYLARAVKNFAFLETDAFINLFRRFVSGANLQATNLQNMDLRNLDLSGMNFSNSNFFNVDFSGSNISCTDFSHSNFLHVNFSDTELVEANFNACNFKESLFLNSDLTSADLSDANFYEVNFRRARLSSANLCRANISASNFNRAYFGSTDVGDYFLNGANLASAILRNVDLREANFYSEASGVNLESISFDRDTNWEEVQNLEMAENVPIALKQQLGLPE
jgi:uncharacterized protein YjbI with pentapeptide repeats